MVFTWEDNYTKEVPFFSNICGLLHKGKRPNKVTIVLSETESRHDHPEQFINYVSRIVKPSLSKDGIIEYIGIDFGSKLEDIKHETTETNRI